MPNSLWPVAVFEGRYSDGWWAVAQFDREDVMGASERLSWAWTKLHGNDVDAFNFKGDIRETPILWLANGSTAQEALDALNRQMEES